MMFRKLLLSPSSGRSDKAPHGPRGKSIRIVDEDRKERLNNGHTALLHLQTESSADLDCMETSVKDVTAA
jgi:hypothetical protein